MILGFWFWDLVLELGFRVLSLGFYSLGHGFTVWFRVPNSAFRVLGFGSGIRIIGLRFWVSGSGFSCGVPPSLLHLCLPRHLPESHGGEEPSGGHQPPGAAAPGALREGESWGGGGGGGGGRGWEARVPTQPLQKRSGQRQRCTTYVSLYFCSLFPDATWQ